MPQRGTTPSADRHVVQRDPGYMRRFSKMHVLHDYYVVSDQRSYTGFRIIIERCRIRGKMKDSLDC